MLATVGYVLLGLGFVDALYQTVTTVGTVGFREVEEFGTSERIFTMVVVLVGVGTALYTFSVVLEALIEGHFSSRMGRRRMERRIEEMSSHVIVCGWGRVGKAVTHECIARQQEIVLVDVDPERVGQAECPHIVGDATLDAVLLAAGVERARVLIAALTTDADNLFVTLTARKLNPSLFIISRARHHESGDKLLQAGANRFVNPQEIGGSRMAAFALQPNVAEFLDVVMHEGDIEFRLEELVVPEGSAMAGHTLRDSQLRDRTGALVLAIRGGDRRFTNNPDPGTVLRPGDVLIAIGTGEQLAAMGEALTATATRP